MKKIARTALIVIIGNFIYAMAVAFFIEPSGLIMGGTTGIGLFFNNVFGWSTSLTVLIMNTVLFLIGWKELGTRFAANTLLSTFCFPIELEIAERLAASFELTSDIVLCTFFGGIIIGVSLGMVIRTGASTGGMDIPPLVLNKYFGTSISAGMWAFDIIILLVQALFSEMDLILYGIVLVILYTLALDKTMILGKSKTQIQVISKKNEDIKRAILSDIDRGVTILHGRTGYLGNDTELVLSVISSRELPKAEEFIHEIDPEAFIIVSRVSEVKGRGFTTQKQYL